jgi:sensor histidine kinase YesM
MTMKKSALYSLLLFASVALISILALYSTTLEHAGVFDLIDETPIIFIVFGFIFFLIFWIADSAAGWVYKRYSVRPILLFQLIFSGIIIYVVQGLKIGEWYPFSQAAAFAKAIILVLPLLVLYRYLNKRYYINLPFRESELFRFMTILVGGVLFLWVSSEIAFLVDSTFLEGVVRKKNQWEPKFLFFGFLFALTLGNLLNNIRKKYQLLEQSERMLSETKLRANESKAALDALQASINPHFLYNALNSIAGLAKHDPEKTQRMAIALSSFYRFVTNKDQKHLSTVREEIEMTRHYLEVEKIRFGDRLQVEMQIENEVLDSMIPHFTLQPLVENAVKYGFSEDEVIVRLEISREGSDLVIRLFDRGKPFEDQLSTGYGLKSITEKLRLLFPDKHELALVNTPQKHVFLSIKQS